MAVKNAMTADFLHSAYGGESMAHMRYLIWGEIAKKEKLPHIARLFEGIAYAEQVHASNHFHEMGNLTGDAAVTAGAAFGVGKTSENLKGAIAGELHEVEQMYPVYLEAAHFQSESGAEKSFHYALEAEKIHAKLFQDAQTLAEEGKDMKFDAVYVCPICGHTILDEVPDHCPVCGAAKKVYKSF
ncbi:MAG: rubrerythrin family protein [Sporomusaceae bacterium]|nr:rubrerythrin family protein [Sporomusaceae bacterium]